MSIKIAGVEFEKHELKNIISFRMAITEKPDRPQKPDLNPAPRRPFLSFANFCFKCGIHNILSSLLTETPPLFKQLVNDLDDPGATILKIASNIRIDNRKQLVKEMLAALDTHLDSALLKQIQDQVNKSLGGMSEERPPGPIGGDGRGGR